jgi:hypothetical protein
MKSLAYSSLAVLAAILMVACDGESTTDSDAGPGGGVDAGPGGGVDAGPGGGVDGGPGGGVDAGPGGGVDGGPGGGVDAGPGGDVDAGPGGGTDSGAGSDASMPTVTGGIGAACTDASDCTVGPTPRCETEVMAGGFFTIEFPGGYCTSECTSPGDCGEGASCVGSDFGMGFCAKTCASVSDCRADEGYECTTPPGLGGGSETYCLPPTDFGLGDGGLPGF